MPTRVEFLLRHHSNVKLLALPTNIRQEMEMVNTLAYYDMATITKVKSFIVQAPEACIIKHFTGVKILSIVS